MSAPTIGELFAGYGGLGMGVQEVLGGELAWYSDVCKFDKDGNAGHYEPHRGPCAILAHRFPGVPNLGDVTKVDWSTVEPVDILTGGSPCQDLSHAGRRAGMTEGTRSNLWVAMREAIAVLRPRVVVWENVRGAYTAAADSAVEPCPGCLGDGSDEPALRALGRVLGDLSDLGYDARWHGLRAADVGAPHGRFRVFVIATDTTSDAGWIEHRDGGAAADASGLRRGEGWAAGPCETETRRALGNPAGRSDESLTLLGTPRVTTSGMTPSQAMSERGETKGRLEQQIAMLPTPRATDGTKGGPGQRGSSGDLMLPSAVALLPTPAVNDMGEGKTVERWDEWTADMQAKHGNGNGHGKSLAIEAQRLLPTPVASEGRKAQWESAEDRREAGHEVYITNAIHSIGEESRWGDYAAAIARWEAALGRPAPEPTQTSSKGNPQLSPAFVEWMMGLPAGWVTDVPGITRNEALKALGNGVVPQQAAEALRVMASWAEAVA